MDKHFELMAKTEDNLINERKRLLKEMKKKIKYSDEQKDAITAYKGEFYQFMNNYLNDNKLIFFKRDIFFMKTYCKNIKYQNKKFLTKEKTNFKEEFPICLYNKFQNLDSAINISPKLPKNIVLYRGIRTKDFKIEPSGGIFEVRFRNYISTTIDPSIAYNFSYSYDPDKFTEKGEYDFNKKSNRIVFEMKINKRLRALLYNDLEYEVLLPRNCIFELKGTKLYEVNGELMNIVFLEFIRHEIQKIDIPSVISSKLEYQFHIP